MNIVRYRIAGTPDVRIGVSNGDRVRELTGVGSLAELWALRLGDIRTRVADASGDDVALADVDLLAPVDGRTEVWAAGVTYETSREARVEESERAATVYEQVYDAVRPEVFFKSVAWRVVGPGGQLGIRADSTVDVPEPELAVVVNRAGEICGYTVCNDVSSRSIEGENPLYLPQAKIYWGACGIGPWIRPAWEVDDPYALGIRLTISRGGSVVWSGTANTGQLRRKLDELVEYLMRGDLHPDGVVLSTGTCLVPAAPFTLADGDTVAIALDEVGTLTNTVRRGRPQGQTEQG